jgi:hypothetical protein
LVQHLICPFLTGPKQECYLTILLQCTVHIFQCKQNQQDEYWMPWMTGYFTAGVWVAIYFASIQF